MAAQSPITYVERGRFHAQAMGLLQALYSGARGLHNYRHTAASNYRAYLRGERVRLKKYLYGLRPLLAARWIEARGTPPPMAFAALLAATELPLDFSEAVADLLARKQAASEMADGPPMPALQRFIEAELERCAVAPSAPQDWAADAAWEALDRLLVDVLGEDSA